jgi:alkylated DNA repair dioxygenase AlkB
MTFPKHVIARHASSCTGGDGRGNQEPLELQHYTTTKGEEDSWRNQSHLQPTEVISSTKVLNLRDGIELRKCDASQNGDIAHTENVPEKKFRSIINISNSKSNSREYSETSSSSTSSTSHQPLVGLFIFEEFITKEEEKEILDMLDGKEAKEGMFLPWKPSHFNGKHMGKRWGVHCNLKDRMVYPEEHPLPPSLLKIIDRIKVLQVMKRCIPNEANAIDYHKNNGDYLKNHVDDRQLSKEPIANLSLAGDCYMTFQLEKNKAPLHFPKTHKVLLKRRTLQILKASSRYG